MARDHLSRFSKGKRGLENVFKRSRILRHSLTLKERKEAIKDLHEHSKGGGISARPGNAGYKSELEKVYGKWRRNTKDRINKAEARMIKRELEKYQGQMENDPRHIRTSRKYFGQHTDPSNRAKDVPHPGGDVRPGSFGSSNSLPTGLTGSNFDHDPSNNTGLVGGPEPRNF